MNVALRQLRAFLSVAKHGSFSRAAQDVGLSQSAISLSVRQLENELGLKLLDRTTRQVLLTAAGVTLVANGSRLIDELDSTLKELRDIGVQHRGRVVMACVPAVARSLMPKCVEYCAAKWPGVSINIDDSAAADVILKVGRGEVEFGIASGRIARAELHIEPLITTIQLQQKEASRGNSSRAAVLSCSITRQAAVRLLKLRSLVPRREWTCFSSLPSLARFSEWSRPELESRSCPSLRRLDETTVWSRLVGCWRQK